ncbi:MAG: cytochrome [Gammaproteobacteria bacterium]|nr:cytochrome [Gammaproteobacteria bacterium]
MTSGNLLDSRQSRFPIGASVTTAQLELDPYAVFDRLRIAEPVSWIPALNMWYVTRYDDVQRVLLDAEAFTTAFERSTIRTTFGDQMLTAEGREHDRYRRAVQPDFQAHRVRASLEGRLMQLVEGLLDAVHDRGTAELRSTFASRLPIQAILCLCDLPLDAEPRVRGWYDRFERALANFTDDAAIKTEAAQAVEELHEFLQSAINSLNGQSDTSLLATLVRPASSDRLTDEEIKRNLSIILFGGISTVEALILNCLWAFHENPSVLREVTSQPSLAINAVEETVRWRSPVQSATRHATRRMQLRDARIEPGEVVNCMLGSANRDSLVFEHPERFILHRGNWRKHVGFATGTHSCLGFHLAKLEAKIAVQALLARLPDFRIIADDSQHPTGYEFHQPRRLQAAWSI